MPVGAKRFSDAVRMGAEVYHALGGILKSRSLSVAVGDEGGFAPDLASDEAAIEVILEAIGAAGYTATCCQSAARAILRRSSSAIGKSSARSTRSARSRIRSARRISRRGRR